MNEWWLAGVLFAITVFAIAVMIYPLRRHRVISTLLVPLVFALASAGYYYWGGFGEWQKYFHENKSQALAQEMLKSIKSPQELIDKLRAKLDDRPESAKGWYLLGRLYTRQNDNKQASEAFAKAYHDKPQDEQFAVNYAHSLWLLNKEQFNPEIVSIFDGLLKNNPNQPDALAMLAMNAFLSHAYEDAIDYWQRLLKLAPEQSEEALAIRKAIAKAQTHVNLGREQDE